MSAILFSAFCLQATAQSTKPSAKILSKQETTGIFADSVCKRLALAYPIRRAYAYTDKTGSYYLVLGQKFYKMSENNDSLYQIIKAINVKRVNNSLNKTWEIFDAINVDETKYAKESSVGFGQNIATYQMLMQMV